ncbi:MAG: hypothetical protein DRJ66_01700 [Thermoprotei archaeon]|nr:MAG: hypothetical protein DRJ66_01700 [Thermoprotei archaeon]
MNSKIKQLFFEYYRDNFTIDETVIGNFRQREYALVPFDAPDKMVRHLAFSEFSELKKYILRNVPLHLYYSTAYYNTPQARNMDEKGWLGADLVFDIDVDHIPTKCKEEHDTWRCLDCNAEGKGMPPEKCPKCGSSRIDKEVWVCNKCLMVAIDETLRLVEEFLCDDFGINRKDIAVYFSGHRGFHIHVEDKRMLRLDQDARREIVDYIKGNGIKVELFNPLPKLSEPGWRGTIAQGIYEILSMINEGNEFIEGLTERDIKYLYEHRESIIKALDDNTIGSFRMPKPLLRRLVEQIVNRKAVNIDERVTTDIKRLIRFPESLHGKTGLKVTKVDLSVITEFDPFNDATWLQTSIKIKVIERIPKLELGSLKLDLSPGDIVILPASIALYIALRGKGEMVELI